MPKPENMIALGGKLALVTGAGTGIGQGIAVELARQGADIAIHYAHSAEGARVTTDKLRKMAFLTNSFINNHFEGE